MRLLLINPKYPESFWSFKWAVDRVLPGKRAINPPLGLATLAALSPAHWEVGIVDENIEPLPLAPAADIIGICGMGVQFPRQGELLEYYRRRGYFVVAGGSYASLCPERYSPLADAVVTGEAEIIWREFCRDFDAGRPRRVYKETGVVDLADSPAPRFDLLKLDRYTTATLQFSRGCPFLCEFCDIIVMFGRKPRHKTLAQVEQELDGLRRIKTRNVFFVDDNLIGNKGVAKELLRFLAQYQRRHGYDFRFGTEASINMAQDPELLALARAANFTWVFVGIESPDPEILKAARKIQNTREDALTSVRRFYAHGIDVLAGFIIGFDNDTLETFETQRRFILDSGIQAAMVGLLTALPRTPLYDRVRREGRLRKQASSPDNTKLGTNIVPKGMDYDVMVTAYQRLHRELLTDRNIARRIRNKLRFLGAPVYQGEYSRREKLIIVGRLLGRGILPGGPSRIGWFLATLLPTRPAKWPLVMVDWIAGLAMRDYVARHFVLTGERQAARAAKSVAALAKTVRRHLEAGRAALSWRDKQPVPELSICIREWLDRKFYTRVAKHAGRMLKRSGASLTLHIESLRSHEIPHAQRMLTKLRKYGDRISVVLDERLYALLPVDSSTFNLALMAPRHP